MPFQLISTMRKIETQVVYWSLWQIHWNWNVKQALVWIWPLCEYNSASPTNHTIQWLMMCRFSPQPDIWSTWCHPWHIGVAIWWLWNGSATNTDTIVSVCLNPCSTAQCLITWIKNSQVHNSKLIWLLSFIWNVCCTCILCRLCLM